MYRYVCERIVPGCSFQDEDRSREKLMERVAIHLREHHELDHREDRITKAIRETGIFFVRPV